MLNALRCNADDKTTRNASYRYVRNPAHVAHAHRRAWAGCRHGRRKRHRRCTAMVGTTVLWVGWARDRSRRAGRARPSADSRLAQNQELGEEQERYGSSDKTGALRRRPRRACDGAAGPSVGMLSLHTCSKKVSGRTGSKASFAHILNGRLHSMETREAHHFRKVTPCASMCQYDAIPWLSVTGWPDGV